MNNKDELILFLRSKKCEIISEDEYGLWYKYNDKLYLIPLSENSIKLAKKQIERSNRAITR